MANQALQLYEGLRAVGIQVGFVQVNAPYQPAWVAKMKGIRAVFRLFPYLYRLYREIDRADIVHVLANSGWSWHLFAAPAVWVAWLLRRPVIVNYRGGEAEKFFQAQWRWVKPTLMKAQAVMVPSAYLKEIFNRRNVDARIVPNMLDLNRFRFQPPEPGTVDAPHLVVTRNLEPLYDVETAVRAFQRVQQAYPGARLTVAGSGPEETRLKTLVAELGLADAVSFPGRLEAEQIAQLYQSADMMLNASRVDNSPNSLIEALACGLPVVTTDVGGIPYLVKDGESAMLVPPGQPEMLADAAVDLLKDHLLRAKLVQNGRQIADGFDQDKVLRLLEQEYRRLVG